MLEQYRTDTRNLLQNPGAPAALYDQDSIDRWINIARGQLAGEAECIRIHGTLSTVTGQRAYNFSDLNVGVAATNGIRGVIHVASANVLIGDGQHQLVARPWRWFSYYALNTIVPENGVPTEWAQYAQGSSGAGTGSGSSGSFYLDPPPDAIYQLSCDCVCYPATLIDDTTVEAIPYLWTDAVPFFAAYYAYLSSQTAARQADALRMFQLYGEFVTRARQASNPSTLRWQYNQGSDISQAMKFGVKQAAAGAAQ